MDCSLSIDPYVVLLYRTRPPPTRTCISLSACLTSQSPAASFRSAFPSPLLPFPSLRSIVSPAPHRRPHPHLLHRTRTHTATHGGAARATCFALLIRGSCCRAPRCERGSTRTRPPARAVAPFSFRHYTYATHPSAPVFRPSVTPFGPPVSSYPLPSPALFPTPPPSSPPAVLFRLFICCQLQTVVMHRLSPSFSLLHLHPPTQKRGATQLFCIFVPPRMGRGRGRGSVGGAAPVSLSHVAVRCLFGSRRDVLLVRRSCVCVRDCRLEWHGPGGRNVVVCTLIVRTACAVRTCEL